MPAGCWYYKGWTGLFDSMTKGTQVDVELKKKEEPRGHEEEKGSHKHRKSQRLPISGMPESQESVGGDGGDMYLEPTSDQRPGLQR